MPLLPWYTFFKIEPLPPFIQSAKELIFPSYCLACKRQLPRWELPLFCTTCLNQVSFINSPICFCCGIPFTSGNDHLCGQCLSGGFHFTLARSASLYQEPVAQLISNLKFNGDLTGISTLAVLARLSPGYDDLALPDLILPVPLHKDRLRIRGYNQALLLARSLLPDFKEKIIPDLLIRNRVTPPQTSLSGIQRRKNLTKAFSVKRPQIVSGKKILLVDDVFTTGSTVNECARTLLKNGAETVEVFTLARAL